MNYTYNKASGQFWQGLPACDLNDEDLNDDQKALLKAGVDAGVYKPVPVPAKSKTTKAETHEPETNS